MIKNIFFKTRYMETLSISWPQILPTILILFIKSFSVNVFAEIFSSWSTARRGSLGASRNTSCCQRACCPPSRCSPAPHTTHWISGPFEFKKVKNILFLTQLLIRIRSDSHFFYLDKYPNPLQAPTWKS